MVTRGSIVSCIEFTCAEFLNGEGFALTVFATSVEIDRTSQALLSCFVASDNPRISTEKAPKCAFGLSSRPLQKKVCARSGGGCGFEETRAKLRNILFMAPHFAR